MFQQEHNKNLAQKVKIGKVFHKNSKKLVQRAGSIDG